jgi:hypothetical protein
MRQDSRVTAADRHRRRQRPRTRKTAAPQATASTAPIAEPEEPSVDVPVDAPVDAPPVRRKPREAPTERGLRDLVGAGHSVLGVSGALRGRDVNRPTDEDLAEAERDVVIVRRHWKPPAES